MITISVVTYDDDGPFNACDSCAEHKGPIYNIRFELDDHPLQACRKCLDKLADSIKLMQAFS